MSATKFHTHTKQQAKLEIILASNYRYWQLNELRLVRMPTTYSFFSCYFFFFESHGYISYFLRSHVRTFPLLSHCRTCLKKTDLRPAIGRQQAVSQHVLTFSWLRQLTLLTDVLTWVFCQPTHSNNWILSCASFLVHIPKGLFLKALCSIKFPFISLLLCPPHKKFYMHYFLLRSQVLV